MTKDPSKTKRKLLEAAGLVVKEKGVTGLTLEAVAKQAKVSKGGLLYHYPNKQELLKAMIAHLNEKFERAIAKQIEQSEGKITWLEAYVAMSFDPQHSQIAESAGLLAAIANDLSLLEPLAERYQVLQQQLEDSNLDSDLANIIRLAADGLWFTELFQISPLTESKRSQVLAALLTLIKEKTND
jgi:AcrR family transcriptional regulator